jgi:hypothetical protein
MPTIQTNQTPEVQGLEVAFEAPAAAAKLEASAAPAELEVELEAPATAVTTPPRGELVPVYILAMHLPSPDLVCDDYTDVDSGTVKRIKEWRGKNAQLAREIETLRRSIYRRLERLWCMVREFGVWIAVTEAGVREAERISKEVRERLHRLGLGSVANRYYVKAIKIYLEPQDAKMLLDAAVQQLSAEVQELGRRIKDAELSQNRRLVRELMYKKEYVKHLLMIFKSHIENIDI